MEGSKFVEMASVDNVKRTWVNYGRAREWSDPTQAWTSGRGTEEGGEGGGSVRWVVIYVSEECARISD